MPAPVQPIRLRILIDAASDGSFATLDKSAASRMVDFRDAAAEVEKILARLGRAGFASPSDYGSAAAVVSFAAASRPRRSEAQGLAGGGPSAPLVVKAIRRRPG